MLLLSLSIILGLSTQMNPSNSQHPHAILPSLSPLSKIHESSDPACFAIMDSVFQGLSSQIPIPIIEMMAEYNYPIDVDDLIKKVKSILLGVSSQEEESFNNFYQGEFIIPLKEKVMAIKDKIKKMIYFGMIYQGSLSSGGFICLNQKINTIYLIVK
jgi:hypothetical protein